MDLISRREAIDSLADYIRNVDRVYSTGKLTHEDCMDVAHSILDELPFVDAVEVVRCKDCKHKPTGSNRDDLEFPDEKCPCQCEDFWYNYKPADEWYCGNGDRKDGDRNV